LAGYDERRRRLCGPTRDDVRPNALQEFDVKDWMNFHGLGKVKSKGTRSNFLHDGERTNALVVELASRAFGLQVTGVQPYLVTNLEVRLVDGFCVKVLGVGFNGSLNAELHLRVQVSQGLNTVRKGDVVLGDARDGNRELWVICEVCKERGLLGRCVGCIVVRELGNRQKCVLVCLLIVDVASQVLFQHGVDAFGLSIGARVEGRGQVLLNVEGLEDAFGDLGCKCSASVGGDIVR
jgi:hypothetical protein